MLYLNNEARRPMDRKERSKIVKYTIHFAASPPEIVEDDIVLHKAPIAFLLGLVLLAFWPFSSLNFASDPLRGGHRFYPSFTY